MEVEDLLFSELKELANGWGETDVGDEEDGLSLRLTPATGFRTFVSVQRQPSALFATDLVKVEFSTLVGTVEADSDAVTSFLDAANGTTIAGAWELFSNGDLGVTGQLLLTDTSEPSLPTLIGQLVALQVADAVAVGRPPEAHAFDDLHEPSLPTVRLAPHRCPDLSEVAQRLRWRSAHHDSHRWQVLAADASEATLLTPGLVTDPVSTNDGTQASATREMTLAVATHPRRGPGILIQVNALEIARDEMIAYRNWGVATQSGRWFGTGLGGLMLWASGGSDEVVYRAFLPLDLLGVLGDDAAADLVVDAALGAVNVTGVAEAIIDSIASCPDAEALAFAVEDRQREMRRRYRVSALRAATHVRQRSDGLADTTGPIVDVGAAVLDRLAIDQLQISTAPMLVHDDGFTWLPGPHVQHVTATGMRPSRRHEVTEVTVCTELGMVTLADRRPALEMSVASMATLPLCSMLLADDGRLQVTSTVLVHEGVWSHRSELVAVLAALQLNCADAARAVLELSGIRPDTSSPLRVRLEAQAPVLGYDPIYQVVPDLRRMVDQRDIRIADLVGIVEARLLDRPGSRLFGELEDEPDIVVLLSEAHPDGGWDPPLGEVLVVVESFEHEIAGESLKVTVNPGFPPGGSDLVAEAGRLTALSHAAGGVPICPSWEVTSGGTVATTLVVPAMAIAAEGLDNGAAIATQAVNSCLQAMARAVISSPVIFSGFDRSQANLTRGRSVLPRPMGPTDANFAVWAPVVNYRVLAVNLGRDDDEFEHWQEVEFTHDAADALADWLAGADNSLIFGRTNSTITGERTVSETRLHLGSRDFTLTNESERSALAELLRHPEAPATGIAPGMIVTYPIDAFVDEDGDTVLLLPPAELIVAVVGSDHVRCAVGAVTGSSLWFRFSSDAGEFYLDVSPALAVQMLGDDPSAVTVTLVIAFPAVDARVVTPPPPAWVGEVSAPKMRKALAALGAC